MNSKIIIHYEDNMDTEILGDIYGYRFKFIKGKRNYKGNSARDKRQFYEMANYFLSMAHTVRVDYDNIGVPLNFREGNQEE